MEVFQGLAASKSRHLGHRKWTSFYHKTARESHGSLDQDSKVTLQTTHRSPKLDYF